MHFFGFYTESEDTEGAEVKSIYPYSESVEELSKFKIGWKLRPWALNWWKSLNTTKNIDCILHQFWKTPSRIITIVNSAVSESAIFKG